MLIVIFKSITYNREEKLVVAEAKPTMVVVRAAARVKECDDSACVSQ